MTRVTVILLPVPLGIFLVVRLVPSSVLTSARAKATASAAQQPVSRRGAAVAIVLIWTAVLIWVGWLGIRWLRS